jgi:hypothetical protein
MATRLPVWVLRAPFGPMAKDTRYCRCARLPLLLQAGAGAVALVALVVVVHSRFTYVKH